MNLMVVPTLALALALYVAGAAAWRCATTRGGKVALLLSFAALAVPGVLFPAYYLHRFDDARWFYEFRSLPLSELTAAGAGLLAGAIGAMARTSVISRPFVVAILVLGIIGPHLKPVVLPLPAASLANRWQGEVCLQSSGSSCGAASAATLMRAAGIADTEADIARACFTYLGGTENWYLARYLRRRGFDVSFVTRHDPARGIPVPSIAGVRYGVGIGHFIPVITETATAYVTGDPLVGREEVQKDELLKRYRFTGFFMNIVKTGPKGTPR